MSYAGPAHPPAPHSGSAAARDTDWQQMAIFGAGLALGILLGAGVALLTAPQSGEEARAVIRRGARRTTRTLGRRSRSAWLDLRDELQLASDSLLRRKARRAAARARRREMAQESEISGEPRPIER